MNTNVENNQFYVYEHRTLDTGRVFYIGKGKGHRANLKASRSLHWKRVVSKHGYTVRFIEKGMTEADAFELEVAAIDFFRWAGAKLANVTDGGDGASGLIWTEDRREKMNVAFNSEKFKDAVSAKTKERWADPEYKQRVSAAIKAAHTTPEAHKLLSARSKKFWKNPEYIAKASETRKLAWQSNERKYLASETTINSWANDDVREKRIAGIKARLNTDEARKKTASSMHTAEAKENNRIAIAKAYADDQEKRRRQQVASQAAFKRPEAIAKKIASRAIFNENRRKWVKDNNYIGNIHKVTKKMMEDTK